MRRRYLLARLAGLYAGAALVGMPAIVWLLVATERGRLPPHYGAIVPLVAALLAVLAVAFALAYVLTPDK